ncbi:MAG: hypothetical protein CSA62_01355 [Planctomycetota bacterium]|nr:MAG: hypothetical protein CSA62_01355 [Planctomycetota bacterium]
MRRASPRRLSHGFLLMDGSTILANNYIDSREPGKCPYPRLKLVAVDTKKPAPVRQLKAAPEPKSAER